MKKSYFSLIELLIVIGILGALCSLMLPGFGNAQEDAKEKVVMTEMREAQNAFRRFASDVMLKNNINKMEDILKYGLWPLMNEACPSSSSIAYSDYDAETGIGRRGPYLQMEGQKTISATPSAGGQASEATGTEIPVLKDPYGGYYRIICPVILTEDTDSEKKEKLQKMVLVYTGPDKNLDTLNTDLDDGKIIPHTDSDDKVIRLMPLATY